MDHFEQTKLNRVVRVPQRGSYDKESVYAIVDEALICHVAFVQDGWPVVIPTLHARQGDTILLHGATTSRLIRHVQAGHPVSIGITLVDGMVLARSVFHHSMNYRSVVLFGHGRLLEDQEKMAALEAFTEALLPGRWADARQPNATELKATSVVAVPIESASAKVRQGPPGDDDEDLALSIWAGVVPMRQQFLTPQPDAHVAGDRAVPDYLVDFLAKQ